MKIEFGNDFVNLQSHQVTRLSDAAGTLVQCSKGALWITQEGDQRDHFAAAGDTIALDRRGLTLIHALEPSQMVLFRAAPLRTWRQRIKAAIRNDLSTAFQPCRRT